MSRKNKWRTRGALQFKRESARYSDGSIWPEKDVLYIRIRKKACTFATLESGELWANDGLYFKPRNAIHAAKQMRRALHERAKR